MKTIKTMKTMKLMKLINNIKSLINNDIKKLIIIYNKNV